MSKFAGKFRKNEDYSDDYEFYNQNKKIKRKMKEHGEIKKKIKQRELENLQDEEEFYQSYR